MIDILVLSDWGDLVCFPKLLWGTFSLVSCEQMLRTLCFPNAFSEENIASSSDPTLLKSSLLTFSAQPAITKKNLKVQVTPKNVVTKIQPLPDKRGDNTIRLVADGRYLLWPPAVCGTGEGAHPLGTD